MWAMLLPLAIKLFKNGAWIVVLLVVCLVIFVAVRRAFKPPAPPKVVTEPVVEVVSGNQLVTQIRRRRTRQVRLHGIAVPDELLGEQATAYLGKLVEGKTADLGLIQGRRWSRKVVALVYTPEQWCTNVLLLEHGLAWNTDDTRPDFQQAEESARNAGKGVWKEYTGRDPPGEYLETRYGRATVMDFWTVFSTFSLAWWTLVLLASLGIMLASERGHIGVATVVLLITGTLLLVMGDLPSYLREYLSPARLGFGALIYVIGGVVWGVVRWVLFVWDRWADFDTFKRAFFTKHELAYDGPRTPIPEDKRKTWVKYLVQNRYHVNWAKLDEAQTTVLSYHVTPSPLEHKAQLVRWMAYWPWSLAYQICRTAFSRLWRQIFNYTAAFLATITNKLFPNPTIEGTEPVSTEGAQDADDETPE